MVLLAGFFWSLQGLILRMIESAGPWSVLFWRSVGAVLFLSIFIAFSERCSILKRLRQLGRPGLIGGFALVFAFGGTVYALQTTTVAMAVFLFSASPFITAALSWLLLRERVRTGTILAGLLAAGGVWLMVAESLAAGAMAGNIAALCAASGFAVFAMALRSGGSSDMLPTVVLGGILAMLAAALVAPFLGQTITAPGRDIAIAVGMGALTLGSGMMLFTLGVRVLPAAEATLLSLAEVLLAPLWVWLVLGETATRSTLLGGAVLMAAVGLNAVTGMRRKPPPPMA